MIEIVDLRRNKLKNFDPIIFDNCLKLSALYLDINSISVITVFPNLPELKLLSFSNNQIKEIDNLRVLQNLENLSSITLFSNPLGNSGLYRTTIIELLPRITSIDDRVVNPTEREKIEKELKINRNEYRKIQNREEIVKESQEKTLVLING